MKIISNGLGVRRPLALKSSMTVFAVLIWGGLGACDATAGSRAVDGAAPSMPTSLSSMGPNARLNPHRRL